MKIIWTILVIVLILLAAALVYLYTAGRKMQARQAESQKMIDAYSQVASMLIIDKKQMKLKDAPFPKEVVESVPIYARFMKVGVAKVKIGPQIVNLMCEAPIYECLPIKKEIKAKISGAYITEILKGSQPSEKELKRRAKEKAKAEKKAKKNK